MMSIEYVSGDATDPCGHGPRILAHVCNDIGAWGAGFVVAISKRWPDPQAAYKRWHADRDNNDFGLGATQLVQVEPEMWVANMVGQHGIRRRNSKTVPVRYEAIDTVLHTVGEHALELSASVHMPRIGCGLAGGAWTKIEPLLARNLVDRGVETFVYDYPA